ncbi:unnamed protein product [Cuscuta epithymum]|uniref:Uncharacterized protein n=1 Tax=Cuscuta epithymum TaxID=186058 RepID=A0AAV0F4J3_9ASTE|nr:unnamed protein product [Cuscuta epithymum]
MSDAPAALHSVSMSPLLKTLPGPFSSLRDEVLFWHMFLLINFIQFTENKLCFHPSLRAPSLAVSMSNDDRFFWDAMIGAAIPSLHNHLDFLTQLLTAILGEIKHPVKRKTSRTPTICTLSTFGVTLCNIRSEELNPQAKWSHTR